MILTTRYDRGKIDGPRPSKAGADGMLRVPAYIARTGIQEYATADGRVIRELRPPEEVFHPDALASFAQVVVTLQHPPCMVDAANAKLYARGATSDDVRAAENRYVATKLLVSDKLAVDAVLTGQAQEVSCGYTCELDFTPGTWEGQAYDAVQRQIRGNHVALVDKGRAGPSVKVRLDSGVQEALLRGSNDAADLARPDPTLEAPMPRMTLDGVDHEIPDNLVAPVKAELAKVRKDAEAKASAAEGERDALKARLDAVDAELKAAKAKADAAPDEAAIVAKLRARADLEAKAAKALGVDLAKFDGKTDDEVRAQVLAKLTPDVRLDGKDPAYLAAAFDMALSMAPRVDHAADVRVGALTDKADKADGDTGPKDVARLDAARRHELATNHLRPIGVARA